MNTREITMMIALALLGACVIAPRHVTASQTLWGSIPPDAQFNIPPDEIDGFSTSIPGVGEVRLAALTVPKKTPAIWWLPNGGRISKPPADWPKGFPNMPLKPNMRAVGMVATVRYVKGYDSKLNSLRWMVMDPSQSTILITSDGTNTPVGHNVEWWFWTINLPTSSHSCVLQVAEPTLDWHTLGVWRPSAINTVRARNWQASSSDPGVNRLLKIDLPWNNGVRNGIRQVTATRDSPIREMFEDDERLVAIGKSGQILGQVPASNIQTDEHYQNGITLLDPLTSVREFRLEVCPYKWQQFPAVSADAPK